MNRDYGVVNDRKRIMAPRCVATRLSLCIILLSSCGDGDEPHLCLHSSLFIYEEILSDTNKICLCFLLKGVNRGVDAAEKHKVSNFREVEYL